MITIEYVYILMGLMLIAFAIYVATLLIAQGIGNTGLWIAFLVFLGVRGLGQAVLARGLTRQAFLR